MLFILCKTYNSPNHDWLACGLAITELFFIPKTCIHTHKL